MNTKENLIFVNGKNRTSEMRSYDYHKETKTYEVKYHDGSCEHVDRNGFKWLKRKDERNPSLYRVRKEGRELNDIRSIDVFEDLNRTYWRIVFANGRESVYRKDSLEIEESCLKQKDAQDIFRYLKEISDLCELKNEETGEKILPKRLAKIDFVGNDVVLAKYLMPEQKEKSVIQKEYIPIFPFGCNNSQYKAVKNAIENQISVIQGPPGTGKTQTILNIIANILIQGKTVQVVSNNNSATENVYEKLSSSKYGLSFIAATLGKSENKKTFLNEQTNAHPKFSDWMLKEDSDKLLKDIKEKSKYLEILYDKQEKLSGLKQEQSQILTEWEYFQQYLAETDVQTDKLQCKKEISSKRWMLLWQECQILSEEKEKISLWFKIKNTFEYGISNWSFYKQDMAKVIATFQFMFYQKKKEELATEIAETEHYIETAGKGLNEELCEQSMAVLKDYLARKYRKRNMRRIFSEEDLWKHPYEVLEEYPVILSTTFSSTTSLKKK